MIPITYSVPSEGTSPKFCRAFAAGCGGVVSEAGPLQPGPVALFGSPKLWPLLTRARMEGREWFYGDHAYFGRGRYYRIARNAFQHEGRGAADPARFAEHGRPVQPWRTTGRHVLVCPQSDVYFSLFGMDRTVWLADVTRRLQQVTDRPIVVRTKWDTTPIEESLVNCWAVVAFSSSAALDALIAGVPVFVLADFAAAYRMGTPDLARIEDPVYPEDREAFLSVLAHQQWTLEEIRQGQAWQALTC